MLALHSNWTKPRTACNKNFFIEDFDILTTVLSALKWREKNGDIKMVTDSVGYDFYKTRGMLDIWNEITCELDDIPEFVNPKIFWAAGKLFALSKVDTPVAVMDTDFIVWDRLAFDNLKDITVIHREELYPDVYPDINSFKMNMGYVFNPNFDWSLYAANTAFYVMKNETLKNVYTDEAVNFMKNAAGDDTLTYMVFAEQRLLPMCAKMLGTETCEFSNLDRLFADGERYFTHTWGMKQQMRDSNSLRYDFCMKCARRLKEDFPEFISLFKKIPEIKDYF